MRRRDHERIVRNLEKEIEHLRRQNNELLDRLMYTTGAVWTPPPAPMEEPLPEPEPYSFAPEQTFDAPEILG